MIFINFDNEIKGLICNELISAEKKFKPFNSAHEGYAILKEEVEELEDNINYINEYLNNFWGFTKENSKIGQLKMIEFISIHIENAIKEAIQVAAMCKRFEKDLGIKNVGQ